MAEKKEKKEIFTLSKFLLKKENNSSYFQNLKDEIPFEYVKYFKRSVCRIDNDKLDYFPTIVEIINIVQRNFNVLVKGTFVNLYENENDYCPYHKDSYSTDVITISFGSKRKFYTRSDKTKKVSKYILEDGDVLFFNEEWNRNYKHSIPRLTGGNKLKDNKGERISVVLFC
jgi:alkylated DNA repair dioxygenase AlkB